MSLHTMDTRSPESLFARLTEMEKIDLRRASADRIAFLAYTVYLRECGGSPSQLAMVRDLCVQQMKDYDASDIAVSNYGRLPAIWKF